MKDDEIQGCPKLHWNWRMEAGPLPLRQGPETVHFVIAFVFPAAGISGRSLL